MADSHRLLPLLWHHPSQDGKGLLHIQQPFNQQEGIYTILYQLAISACLNICKKNSQIIKDKILILGVAALVAVDITILVTYTLVEGIRGNLVAQKVSHKEIPTTVEGVSVANRYHNSVISMHYSLSCS